MLFFIDEILIPALESAINGFVKLVQTKAFWITVSLVVATAFGISALTGLSLREVASVEHISNFWGLADTGSDTPGGSDSGDSGKYRGGATPYDQ